MNKDNTGDFWKTVFDGALDGVPEGLGRELNKRIYDRIPYFLDCFERVIGVGIEKLKEFFLNHRESKSIQSLSTKNIDLNNVEKLYMAVEKFKSNTNDKEAQKELIETVTFEISDKYLMWELLGLLTREVECPHCKEIISEYWYDYICGESSCERNMGTKTIYSVECDEFQCPKCNGLFAVDGFICAYPNGIYDSHKLNTSVI